MACYFSASAKSGVTHETIKNPRTAQAFNRNQNQSSLHRRNHSLDYRVGAVRQRMDGCVMKAKYDCSLVWQLLKEDKEKAPASGSNTGKSDAKEINNIPIIRDTKGNVK